MNKYIETHQESPIVTPAALSKGTRGRAHTHRQSLSVTVGFYFITTTVCFFFVFFCVLQIRVVSLFRTTRKFRSPLLPLQGLPYLDKLLAQERGGSRSRATMIPTVSSFDNKKFAAI